MNSRCVRSRGALYLVYGSHYMAGSQFSMVTPLVVSLVKSFLRDEGFEASSTGEYQALMARNVGVLLSAFFWTCAISGVFWGVVADRLGRRFALIGGVLLCFLSNVVLACSTTFVVAVSARVLAGLDGNLGINKVYLVDLVEAERQPRALASMEVCYSLATIISPLLGGLLPGMILPGLGYAPAFWPGVYAASLSLVLLVLCCFYLPETRATTTKTTTTTTTKEPAGDQLDLVSSTSFLQWFLCFVRDFRLEIAAIVAYAAVAFVLCGSDTVVTLGVESERGVGGMGLPKSYTGNFYFIQGIVRTFSAMIVFPFIATRWGALVAYRSGVSLMAVLLALIYVPTKLARHPGIVLMYVLIGLSGFGRNLSTTSAIMVVTNSTVKRTRGWTLGSCQSFGSLSRALGTCCFPLICAFGALIGCFYLPYVVISTTAAVIFLLSFLLPRQLSRARDDPVLLEAKTKEMQSLSIVTPNSSC